MRVRLEPLGEELDCAPGETVLDAAFRHGLNLAHGCREGQCSACKCHLLSGDVDLRPYSTFALSDAERENGYALMCRAVPESELVVELLHYDPDNCRLENPIRESEATVVSLAQLTHDIVGVTLALDGELTWMPGQYVDVHAGDVKRSFSVANLPNADGRVELIVRRYRDGRLSSRLGREIVAGSRLRVSGPYGACVLRRSERPILLIAAGSGMAPVLALLRQLAAEGCRRPVRFYYGARTERDLFMADEIRALALEDFEFIPVTGRHVHEAVEPPDDPDVYMCGPPPMLQAAERMLVGRGVDPERIFQDRFTTAAEAAVATGPAGAPERAFAWFEPAGRRATLYEDVTVDTQPSVHRHLTRGWPLRFADGRGTWDDDSTALRSADWFAFRDPGGQWERTFYQRGARVEAQLEDAMRTSAAEGLLADVDPAWIDVLRAGLQIPAFVEHGLWLALATAARDCLSDSVATCVCLEAAHKQRSAQALVLYALDLSAELGCELPIEPARAAFLHDPRWQPARRYLERLAATADWGEVIVAANLCFEPVVGTLLRRELGIRAATAHRDTITPVLARAAAGEWEWARAWTVAFVRFLLPRNRATVEAWIDRWRPAAWEAAAALGADDLAPGAMERVRAYADGAIAEALEPAVPPPGEPRPAVPPPGEPRPAALPPGEPRPVPPATGDAQPRSGAANGAGSGDHVGIVMARSAEGDAVARFFAGGRADVIEQPAFWEIRAPDRLVIPYDAVSEELGYAVDAYSLQHEMSTHYGRLIATDDALMLFADPVEAMEHLVSPAAPTPHASP